MRPDIQRDTKVLGHCCTALLRSDIAGHWAKIGIHFAFAFFASRNQIKFDMPIQSTYTLHERIPQKDVASIILQKIPLYNDKICLVSSHFCRRK